MTDGPAIGDHALIGDCRTAALVDARGTVAWMCLPNFSGPAVFAAVLDPERGGGFALATVAAARREQRYVDGTAVLETVHATDTGRARVRDLMPLMEDGQLQPMRELLRIVEGIAGECEFELCFQPRPGFGGGSRARVRTGSHWVTCAWGGELLVLRAEVPLQPTAAGARARFRVRAGERVRISLAFASRDIAVLPPLGAAADARLDGTVEWWHRWSAQCTYHGRWQAEVLRSAITLRLLTYALSGAVLAAPTTSLPEVPGGEANWDYRYCWIRDAALVMRSFTGLGFRAEAEGFLYWLLHATALTWPRLQVLYDVHGRAPQRERGLPWLAGHGGARPVRIGNAAAGQRQLDVYGGLIAAVFEYVAAGGVLEKDEARLVAGFGRLVCRQWRLPDNSIWELRGEPRHFTFSRMMCWIALRRLLDLAGDGKIRVAAAELEREIDAIREDIEQRAWDQALGAYAGELDGEWLDASLLLAANLGYSNATDGRMRGTARALQERLGHGALLHRFEQRPASLDGEGAFTSCSFWAIEHRARAGDVAGAERQFEAMLELATATGLYAEEIDPADGSQRGNFPQAFTHAGMVSAALAIQAARAQ